MKTIFELLNPDNTMSINRRLAHAVGLTEAVFYSALLSKYAYYEQHGLLDKDGWFYSTAEDMEESTALTARQQRRCIDTLVEAGLIKLKVQGMPAKRYFYIIDDAELIEKILSNGGKSSFDKSAKLDDTQKKEEPRSDSIVKPNNAPKDTAPVLTKCQNKFYPNVETSLSERKNFTFKKSKDINLKSINLSALRIDDISRKYGNSFSVLVEDVIEQGLTGRLSFQVNGRTVSNGEIARAYKNLTHETICIVADYISEKKNIRHLHTYLSIALYSAAIEQEQEPKGGKPVGSGASSIDTDGLMSNILKRYGSTNTTYG